MFRYEIPRNLFSEGASMIIHQAIYASANGQFNRGYHLVSRSSGVPEHVAQGLCRWCPSHGCLSEDSIETDSLNFFQPSQHWFAISRSVYGSPEFSQRGGRQVVSINLILHADQLTRFEYNAVSCARFALSAGLLTLPLEMPPVLPHVDFPDALRMREIAPFDTGKIQNLLRLGKPVAIIGSSDPLAYMERLLHSTPQHERPGLAFATGVKPSAQRPFQLQFFRSADKKLKNDLIRQGFSVRECSNAYM